MSKSYTTSDLATMAVITRGADMGKLKSIENTIVLVSGDCEYAFYLSPDADKVFVEGSAVHARIYALGLWRRIKLATSVARFIFSARKGSRHG